MFGVNDFRPKNVATGPSSEYDIQYADIGRSYYVINDACISIRATYDYDNRKYYRTDKQLSLLLCKAALSSIGFDKDVDSTFFSCMSEAFCKYITDNINTGIPAPAEYLDDRKVLGLIVKPWHAKPLMDMANCMLLSLSESAKDV